jgi:hypothetical protein
MWRKTRAAAPWLLIAALGLGGFPCDCRGAAATDGPGKSVHLHPRYVRLYTDAGVALAEANYQHATLDWEVPLNEIALVCLDCWNWHYSQDTRERMERVVREGVVPLLGACRAAGVLVIHAPAGPVAQRHSNWARLTEGSKAQAPWTDSPAWPPAEFKQKTGRYAPYARPTESQDAQRKTHAQEYRDFHPLVRPIGDEPVVLNGEELHRLCAARKILHLVYVGFNTNACIMLRDYGLPAMNRRGYTTILVRDGTTGMETAETCKDQACTRGAIADLEQFGSYTLGAREIVEALAAVQPVQPGGDPFIGAYLGTFQSLGRYAAPPNPDVAKAAKPQTCGSCHAEATVERGPKDYTLTLLIAHGKDKQGNPLTNRITLPGERQGSLLSFRNENYSLTLANGKLTGGRTGKMAAIVELQRKPEAGSR